MNDFLVTIKLRVRVTDPEILLAAARERDPALLEQLHDEPELALSLAIQEAVSPPDVRRISGLTRADATACASVKAEPWPSTGDPW
jgi:hypothetical protein